MLHYFIHSFTHSFIEERKELLGWGGVEGEGERESQAGSMPSTEPKAGPDLTTLRS